jgi:hypothetical protein
MKISPVTRLEQIRTEVQNKIFAPTMAYFQASRE